MNRTRLHPLSLALIAALSHTATAQTGEQTQTPSAVALAPIVVNVNPLFNNYTVADSSAATGLNLSLKDTPQTVTVITARQIDNQNLLDLKDIIKQSPGVHRRTYGNGNTGYNSYVTRGYDIDNFRIDGANRLHLSKSQALNTVDSAIYEAATLVRGSTGLAGGLGEPGGTIEFTRKKPDADKHTSIEAGTGNWQHYRSVIDTTGALNSDASLRGRAIIAHDRGGEWQHRAEQHRTTLYGTLEYDLSPDTTLNAGVQYSDANSKHSAMHSYDTSYGNKESGYRPTGFGPRANSAADWSYRKARHGEIFAHLKHRFANDWTLRANYSYSTGKREQLYGIAGTYGIQPDGSARLVGGYWEFAPKEHAIDIAIDGHYTLFGRTHDLSAGISYNHFDDDNNPQYERKQLPVANIFTFNGNIARPDFEYKGNGGIQSRLATLYGSTRLNLTDQWTLVAGARLANWHSKERNIYTNFAATEQKENAILTPFIGTTYALTGHLSAYASYSTIYKPQSALDIHKKRLDPESGSTLEAGLKGEWQDGRLNASAAIFELRKDNLAVVAGKDSNGDNYYRDEDGTKGRGLEAAIGGEILPGWQISASYAHVKIKDQNGKRLKEDMPAHQIKLFTTHDINDAWTIGANLNWQSAINEYRLSPADNVREEYAQKAYATVDLMSAWHPVRNIRIAVHANNIFNKHYKTNGGAHSYGAPRNIMATLRYTF